MQVLNATCPLALGMRITYHPRSDFRARYQTMSYIFYRCCTACRQERSSSLMIFRHVIPESRDPLLSL